MIREHQKSCEYQGLSFEIIVLHYGSGMQAFENRGTLSDEGPRAAIRCSLSCPSILPRQFSVSPELWTQSTTVLKFFLAESALKNINIFLPRASCTLRWLAYLLPAPTSATTPGRIVTHANTAHGRGHGKVLGFSAPESIFELSKLCASENSP